MFSVFYLQKMLGLKELRFPLIFGVIGAFFGLWLRYFFMGGNLPVTYKFMLHAHSHLMILGFIFNALLLLVWQHFSIGFDKISKRYFYALQVFTGLMVIAFLYQGYALYSITFSTLHLWTSYILLIRLWKRLRGNRNLILMIKAGIVFHFLSSIGPYALGPLMVLGLKNSPWYQQAVFFYLHFQFFGIYFIWVLALFFKRVNLKPDFSSVRIIVLSLVFLFAHSLDFSFDHLLLNFTGGLASSLLFIVLVRHFNYFKKVSQTDRMFYYLLLLLLFFNILGSIPFFADLVVEHRMMLIAWLHFIFLGFFAPFIWMMRSIKLDGKFFTGFITVLFLTETLLISGSFYTAIFGISVMKALFYTYLLVLIYFILIHFKIYRNYSSKRTVND